MSYSLKFVSALASVGILCLSQNSYAILDFLASQAKDTAQAVAFADAASDLIREVSPNDELKQKSSELGERAEKIASVSRELNYIDGSMNDMIHGPQWTSRRVDENIRTTSDYVRRLKHLIAEATVLGTQGSIALNTTETNLALNEVQRNQQTMILQNEDQRLSSAEKDVRDRKEWNDFLLNQKKIRSEGF